MMMNVLRRLMGMRIAAPADPDVPYAAGRGRKRGFTRHPVQVPAVVRAGRRTVEGMSGSLGMGGLFLLCHDPLPPHTSVTVELEAPQAGLPAILAKGAVAYSLADGMGIRFTGISQADCRHLRALFLQAAGAS